MQILAGVGAPAVGDYNSIAGTVVVAAGGQATITFSAIPSTYTHLQIRCMAQTDRATVSFDGEGSVDVVETSFTASELVFPTVNCFSLIVVIIFSI